MSNYEPDSGPQTLMEVNLRSELRKLMDGEDSLPPTGEPIGRIVWLGGGAVPADGLAPDSRIRMGMASPNVDDERRFEVTVEVLIGRDALVAISSDRPVPRQALWRLAERSARELIQAVANGAKDFELATDVAAQIRYAALSVLRGRIDEIEESVREALADENVTEEDYAALREYPRRLATVEEHCRAVRDVESESLRPAPATTGVVLRPITPLVDMFWKHADEVEDEARRAVATLSGLVSSQQVVIVQRQRLDFERLQRLVTVVGAAVLVPGLVAAVFGANVNVPGEGIAAGFWGMLLLMAAGGLGTYWVLRSTELGLLSRLIARIQVPERTWLTVLAIAPQRVSASRSRSACSSRFRVISVGSSSFGTGGFSSPFSGWLSFVIFPPPWNGPRESVGRSQRRFGRGGAPEPPTPRR